MDPQAAAAAGPAAVHPSEAQPTSFSTLYQGTDADPYQGDYTALLTEYRSTAGAPLGDALFAKMVATPPSIPTVHLALYEDPSEATGRTMAIHGFHRYPAVIGRPTEWDDQVFAFVGDVTEGNITSVVVTDEILDLVDAAHHHNVPATLARVDELWAQDLNASLIGPFADGDAHLRQIRTREVMAVPPKYAPLIINRRLTPRQLWTDLVGAIRAEGEEDMCRELVGWCVLCCIADGPGAHHSVMRTAVPQAPLADANLHKHRRWVLLQQLPALGTAAIAPVDAATAQLANYVGQMVTEQRQSRQDAQDRAAESKAPKLPSALWGEDATRRLCVMCQVPTESDLPEMWHAIAAAGKRDRIAVEMVVTETAREMGHPELAPIITPELAKKILSLRLGGNNLDDLSEGVQPFAITIQDYTSQDTEADANTARQKALEYDILTQGSTSTTLTDARAIRTSKVQMPTDYMQLRAYLHAQDVLNRALLGATHPLTVALHQFLTAYANRELFYRGRLQRILPVNGPAIFMRFFQLHIVHWHRELGFDGSVPDPPAFKAVLNKLSLGDTSWIPELPARYLKPVADRSIIVDVADVSGITPLTGATTPSTITTGTDTSSKRQQTLVSNPSPSTVFDDLKQKAGRKKISDAIAKAGEPPLVTRDGTSVQMCVSYHLRGSCWSKCNRRLDHGPHNEEEDLRLLEWCKEAYS
jgi:hypothetical protein